MQTSSVWTSQMWWYLARSGGIVAWVLLACSTVWGLLLSTKLFGRRPRPAWLLDLHRFLGGLGLVFTGVHVIGLVLDSYVHFGPVEILVPFASSWQPAAVAWGVIGAYLLLAVELTSLLRARLPRPLWRTTHLLSFPLFGFSTLHALTAGTDAGTTAWQMVMALLGATVLGLIAARQVRRGQGGARGRAAQVREARVPAGSRRRG